MENQQIVNEQTLITEPKELFLTETSVSIKDVDTNSNWTFELGQSGESTPTCILVAFQARHKNDSQTHDNSIFDR